MIQELIATKCYYPLKKGNHFIYDDSINNVPLFRNEEEKWNLNLVNHSENPINFFQNDGCLMVQNELKKCDWTCFKDNEFYFIEAKDVKANSRRAERNDAIEKFKITITYYVDLYPTIKKMKLFVIMNFRSSKITNAANKAKEAYFDQEYNAKYKETNFLKFT
jgi:hypothetical protein